MTTMKNLLLILLSAFLAVSSSQAALITYTDSKNVYSTGTSFSFSQFNSSLGTLTAIDLIINSITPSGSITVTNNAGDPMSVDAVESRFRLPANSPLGLTAYSSSYTSLSTSPDSSGYNLGGSSSQAFAVLGGQSLINFAPVTRSISSSAFSSYLGSGTVSFNSSVQNQIDTMGEDYSVTSTGYYGVTSLTLRYTYTEAPSPVPEPGQVAASLLVLGGLGIYFLLRRRRSARVSG